LVQRNERGCATVKHAAISLFSAGLMFCAGTAMAASNDQNFATKAAQGGLAEVQAGQLAQQKATDAQVKQFGQTLVQDHTAANQELQQIAKAKGLSLPQQPSEDQKSELKKLQGLSGKQFDQQFVQGEIQDHQKTIALFQQEANSGKDGTLKSYAEKGLPMLRRHLQIAQSLAGTQK
jgi:putative membrane protein